MAGDDKCRFIRWSVGIFQVGFMLKSTLEKYAKNKNQPGSP